MMNITAWIKSKYPVVLVTVSAVIVFLFFLLIYPSFRGRGKDSVDIETFRTTNGWGYQVMVNKEVYIFQPFIPGQQKRPFPSKKTARKAARIVEDKLKSGNLPSLTREELETIGAIESE